MKMDQGYFLEWAQKTTKMMSRSVKDLQTFWRLKETVVRAFHWILDQFIQPLNNGLCAWIRAHTSCCLFRLSGGIFNNINISNIYKFIVYLLFISHGTIAYVSPISHMKLSIWFFLFKVWSIQTGSWKDFLLGLWLQTFHRKNSYIKIVLTVQNLSSMRGFLLIRTTGGIRIPGTWNRAILHYKTGLFYPSSCMV